MNVHFQARLGLAVLLLAGCQGGPSTPEQPDAGGTPEQTWVDFVDAVAAEDAERVMGALSSESRSWLASGSGAPIALVRDLPEERLAGLARDTGIAPARLKAMPTTDLVRVLVGVAVRRKRPLILSQKWRTVEISGDRAVAVLDGDGGEEKVVLVREQGAWKVDLPSTRRIGGGRLARW
jgi:hypothetical protein